jgi:uncharacterized membrane protein
MPNLAPQTDNDRVLAALCYFLAPLVGIVLYFTPSRQNPYLRYHLEQSIVLGVGVFALYLVAYPLLFLLCLPILVPIAIQLYYTYKAYTTPVFTIPYLTDLARRVFNDFPG